MATSIKPSRERTFKSAMFDGTARIGKALASGVRVELLDLLSQRPRGVDSLAMEMGQSVANTSQHLQVLAGARLVAKRREGTFAIYSLADPSVADLLRLLRNVGQARVTEMSEAMDSFMAHRDTPEPVDPDELKRLLGRNAVTIIDVRPEDEYRESHLKGAVSVPVPQLETRLLDLPEGQDIIAYCRGPFCVMALNAVDILVAKGHRARHAALGLSDFKALGLEFESEIPSEEPVVEGRVI